MPDSHRFSVQPRWMMLAPTACAVLLASTTAVSQNLPRNEVRHVLNRVSFGPTPEQLATIDTVAELTQYLRDQLLAPSTGYGGVADALIVDPGFLDEGPNGLAYVNPVSGFDRDALQAKQAILALESPHQLREVMTWFWEQHFSTSINGVRSAVLGANVAQREHRAVYIEWEENQVFREHALGNFRDLLEASTFSPAMRLYLNLVFSGCRSGNEDYAREVLELHTVGPFEVGDPTVPNYTTADIQIATEVFRGLSVNSDYAFPTYSMVTDPVLVPPIAPGDYWCHWGLDYSGPAVYTRQLFGTSTTVTPWSWTVIYNDHPNWEAETHNILDHLASADQTKRFVCTKLIRWFVGDAESDFTPDLDGLLNDCVSVWGTQGNMKAVLTKILLSGEFRATRHWQRLKNPLESTISQARLLNGRLGDALGQPIVADRTELLDRLSTIRAALSVTGATPHEHPAPDGYPLRSQRQPGTAVFWQHGGDAARIYTDTLPGGSPSTNLPFDPVGVLMAEVQRLNFDWNNSTQVSIAAIALLYDRRFSALDRTLAESFLTIGGGWLGTTDPADSAKRVSEMTAYLFALPQALEK